MLPLGDTPIPPVPGLLDPLATLGTGSVRQQSAATYRPISYVNSPPLPAPSRPSSANAFNTISSFPKSPPSIGSTPNNGLSQLYPGDSAGGPSYSSITADNQLASHPHLHGHNNNHHGRRREPHNLNKLPRSDKKFYWKIVGYSNCTEPCGGGVEYKYY